MIGAAFKIALIEKMFYCNYMENTITNTIEETYRLASDFVQKNVNGSMVLCLKGDLGAGKTTFTQGILKEFNANGPYISPTFSLVKEYEVDKYGIKIIYHIDAYRISNDDVESIGWNDIINNKKALIIIEWPENIKKVLPQDVYVILCKMIDENKRQYIFNN